MRWVWIGMGLWVDGVILVACRALGILAAVHAILQGLYQTTLVRKPLWTAFVLHLLLIGILWGALILAACLWTIS
jgi:multisubunit Na+/H+ antiporter MnhC subunit